jgi:hypothetical protein
VQYDRRRISYDFDMIEYRWDESLSPGNEQAFYWGSAAADEEGTRNYMGAKSAAIDAMIAAMLKARERDEFIATVRALDRLLMSGFYVVPLFHLPEQWIARWKTIAHPAATSLFGYLPETWWRRNQTTATESHHETSIVILDDPNPASSIGLASTGASPRPIRHRLFFVRRGTPSRRNRASRSSQSRKFHRRSAAPHKLCRSGSHCLRDRGAAAPARLEHWHGGRHPTAQYGRERAYDPRGAARE